MTPAHEYLKMNVHEAFIWTEVFNCGPLAGIVIPSYIAHHDSPVHVFGFEKDLEFVPDHPQVRKMRLPRKRLRLAGPFSSAISDSYISKGYRNGHLGTSRLWSYLIKSRAEKFLIHFDADIVFLGNAIDDVLESLRAGAYICGPRRMYKWNLNKRDDIRHQADCIDTLCFGFEPSTIKKKPYGLLTRQMLGYSKIDKMKHRIPIDFFDSLTMDLAEHGPLSYLDSPFDGTSGHRIGTSPFLSKILDVRSAVGSGFAFAAGFGRNVNDEYRTYALESYSIYSYYLLGIETGISRPFPGELEKSLLRLDKDRWLLRE